MKKETMMKVYPRLNKTGRIELDHVLEELHEVNYLSSEVLGDVQLAAALCSRHGIGIAQAMRYVDEYRKAQGPVVRPGTGPEPLYRRGSIL